MSPQERKIDCCTPNQLKIKHISPSLNPQPSLIPHHIQQVSWHPLKQSRDSLRHRTRAATSAPTGGGGGGGRLRVRARSSQGDGGGSASPPLTRYSCCHRFWASNSSNSRSIAADMAAGESCREGACAGGEAQAPHDPGSAQPLPRMRAPRLPPPRPHADPAAGKVPGAWRQRAVCAARGGAPREAWSRRCPGGGGGAGRSGEAGLQGELPVERPGVWILFWTSSRSV